LEVIINNTQIKKKKNGLSDVLVVEGHVNNVNNNHNNTAEDDDDDLIVEIDSIECIKEFRELHCVRG